MIYPWHNKAWQDICAQLTHIPNAWLFLGQEGIGKVDFARTLAQRLLCEQPHNQQACGQCISCHLSTQNNHPDFYELTPQQDEEAQRKLKQIKVDAIRDMIEHIHLSPLRAPLRVVLIHPAESLNLQAANALLKILEEPSESVVFILITHSRDKLLPTIKSRCRQMSLPAPTHAQAVEFLKEKQMDQSISHLAFHNQSPLFIESEEDIALREDLLKLLSQPRVLGILDYAAHFDRQKKPLSVLLEIIQKWTIDLIACQQTLPPRYCPEWNTALQKLSQRCQMRTLFAFYDRLHALIPYGQHTLNVKLNSEAILMDYLKLFMK